MSRKFKSRKQPHHVAPHAPTRQDLRSLALFLARHRQTQVTQWWPGDLILAPAAHRAAVRITSSLHLQRAAAVSFGCSTTWTPLLLPTTSASPSCVQWKVGSPTCRHCKSHLSVLAHVAGRAGESPRRLQAAPQRCRARVVQGKQRPRGCPSPRHRPRRSLLACPGPPAHRGLPRGRPKPERKHGKVCQDRGASLLWPCHV